MGFLKKILSPILSLVNWLLGLVGVGKKSEYFLEIDESQATPAPKQITADAKPEAKSAPQKAEPAPVAANGNAPSENTANGNGSKTPVAAPMTTLQEASASKAAQNGSKPAENPQPVAAAKPAQGNQTFAPQYLNPAMSQSSRRRPGANMGTFMSMARNVKTPGS
jgi:hypothetical protein